MSPLEEYYHYKEEPLKSCMQAAREFILSLDAGLSEDWKYRMPFFMYKKRMFCYLWIDKKTLQPYVGIVEGRQLEHPLLIQAERARMKIFMLDVEKKVPEKVLGPILRKALKLY